jgi:hypothetical protein
MKDTSKGKLARELLNIWVEKCKKTGPRGLLVILRSTCSLAPLSSLDPLESRVTLTTGLAS